MNDDEEYQKYLKLFEQFSEIFDRNDYEIAMRTILSLLVRGIEISSDPDTAFLFAIQHLQDMRQQFLEGKNDNH